MSYHADIERRARERVGTTLRGKYQLDSLLGLGGMAAVYSATHKNRNRVAVKMLHAELAINADIRARFLREGYVANTVDHPGALKILDDDELEDGSVYLVMELLDGETLESRLDRLGPKVTPLDVATIALEVCDILAAAHAKNVVHRDIKPDNTFITKQGAVKILDFGIARLREGEGSATSTQTGQTVGTPAFMAPEQALGETERIGPATDVWSVGATMFTALTGRFVHPAKTQAEMLVFAASRTAPAIATVATGVPSELASIIDKALAFDPHDRFPNAAAMRDALRAAIAKLSPTGHRISLTIVGDSPSLRKEPAVGKTAFDATQVSSPDLSEGAASATSGPPWARSPVNTTAGVSSGRLAGAASARRKRTIALAVGVIGLVGVATIALRPRREEKVQAILSATPTVSTTAPAASPIVLPSVVPMPVPTPSATPAPSPTHTKPPKQSTATIAPSIAPRPPAVDPLDRQ